MKKSKTDNQELGFGEIILKLILRIIFLFFFILVISLICSLAMRPTAPEKEKATLEKILSVPRPPRIGEYLYSVDIEKLKHYNHLADYKKFVTVFNDNGILYTYHFILHTNRMAESSNYQFEQKDSVLFGYDERLKKIYAFQLNIFDWEIAKNINVEKAFLLGSRFLPNVTLKDFTAAESFSYKRPDSTVYCYIANNGVALSLTERNDGYWIIRGADETDRASCYKYPNAKPWKISFQQYFDQVLLDRKNEIQEEAERERKFQRGL